VLVASEVSELPVIELGTLPGIQGHIDNASETDVALSSNVDRILTSPSLTQSLFLDGFALTASDYINKGQALRYATKAGSTKLVRQLLDHGADVNQVGTSGWTNLHLSAQGRYSEEILNMLITAGADLKATDQKFDITAFHSAVLAGSPDTVRLLISRGANISATGKDRCYPLHYAAVYGWVEVIQVLIDANTDIQCVDEAEATPLHHACIHGHPDAVRLLTACGALISSTSKDGDTPLHIAA